MKKYSLKLISIIAAVFMLCSCAASEEKNAITGGNKQEKQSIQQLTETEKAPLEEAEKSSEQEKKEATKAEEGAKEEKKQAADETSKSVTKAEEKEAFKGENTEEPSYEEEMALPEKTAQSEEKAPNVEKDSVPEEASPEKNTVTLVVNCADILTKPDTLKKEKRSLVPDNGILFSSSDVEIKDGESVFDVLKRALTDAGVHLEFNLAPVTNSAYIEGIGNIYEFDCGERSGWSYSVNGELPQVGCSDYKVSPEDKIEFIYKVVAY